MKHFCERIYGVDYVRPAGRPSEVENTCPTINKISYLLLHPRNVITTDLLETTSKSTKRFTTGTSPLPKIRQTMEPPSSSIDRRWCNRETLDQQGLNYTTPIFSRLWCWLFCFTHAVRWNKNGASSSSLTPKVSKPLVRYSCQWY